MGCCRGAGAEVAATLRTALASHAAARLLAQLPAGGRSSNEPAVAAAVRDMAEAATLDIGARPVAGALLCVPGALTGLLAIIQVGRLMSTMRWVPSMPAQFASFCGRPLCGASSHLSMHAPEPDRGDDARQWAGLEVRLTLRPALRRAPTSHCQVHGTPCQSFWVTHVQGHASPGIRGC